MPARSRPAYTSRLKDYSNALRRWLGEQRERLSTVVEAGKKVVRGSR